MDEVKRHLVEEHQHALMRIGKFSPLMLSTVIKIDLSPDAEIALDAEVGRDPEVYHAWQAYMAAKRATHNLRDCCSRQSHHGDTAKNGVSGG